LFVSLLTGAPIFSKAFHAVPKPAFSPFEPLRLILSSDVPFSWFFSSKDILDFDVGVEAMDEEVKGSLR
jgi:hypothetical protein